MVDQTKYTSKLHSSRVLALPYISSSNPARVQEDIASLRKCYPSSSIRVGGYVCEMGNDSSIEGNVISLLEQIGELDHIVYTAGDSVPPMPIAKANLDSIRQAGTVRYVGPIFVAKHAPRLLKPGPASSITLTTGVVIDKPIPYFSVVAGPRHAVVGLRRNLALDLKPTRVNVVSVGAVDTETWSPLSVEARKEMFNTLVSRSTTGRIAQAADVAEAYIYCMKDCNISGSVVSTNGGVLLM